MIYLIDDDMSVRRGFELFFKSAGMEYKSFTCADEFLLTFKPETNDLIVLDLNLPGMKGNDLLKHLKNQVTQIPVIVVTAFDDEQKREDCRQYGIKAYLRKPVDGEALIDIIKYNLQQ